MARTNEHQPSANNESDAEEDPWIKAITDQVWNRKMTAAEAINIITQKGKHDDNLDKPGDYVVIGTALSAKKHYPMPSMEGDVNEKNAPIWSLLLPDEETGTHTRPILRGDIVAETAIHTALGGDVNYVQQRLRTDLLLTPPADFYHGPTFGWEYDPESGGYIKTIHQKLAQAIASLPDNMHVGAADVTKSTGFDIEIPGEPGHFGSYDVHERIGSVPVRIRDVRQNMAGAAIRYLNYIPLPA